MRTLALSFIAFSALSANSLLAADPVPFHQFKDLINKYCVECHNPADEKGSLDLAVLETRADYLADVHLLEDLEWVIAEKEMPQPGAPKQPTTEERDQMVGWLVDTLMQLQNAQPNDPGPVVMPRISSKEFDYVIADLTGKNLELAQYLTSDTAAGEGFYNVGAGQNLSIGQFESFMSVGRMLMSHARFVPGLGIWWMSTPEAPLESDEDLGPFLKAEWADWHETVHHEAQDRHVDELKKLWRASGVIAAYLEAAWQYENRSALGGPGATYDQIAEAYEVELYASGVEKVHRILTGDIEHQRARSLRDNLIIAELIHRWEQLPRPRRGDRYGVREEITAIMEWFDIARDTNDWYQDSREVDFQVVPEDRPDSQQRRGFYHQGKGYLKLDLSKVPGNYLYLAGSGELYPSETKPIVIWRNGEVTLNNGSKRPWQEVFTRLETHEGRSVDFGYHPGRRIESGEVAVQTPGYIKLRIPENAKMLEVSGEYDVEQNGRRVLRVKPFAEEPPNYTQTFKDRKVIGAQHPDREIRSSVKDLVDASTWDASFRNLYTRRTLDYFVDSPEVIREYLEIEEGINLEDSYNHWRNVFAWTPQEIRNSATAEQKAKGKEIWDALANAAAHTDLPESQIRLLVKRSLESFANKAWRREATDQEVAGLVDIYESEAGKDLSTEQAMETAMRAVVISPNFLYRFTESRQSEDPYPLSAHELATKLAFTLWSGLPDRELNQLAENGRILEREVMLRQIDRMLADPKADRFIEEFLGRWLGFAEFDSFAGPDQEKFKEFTPELREDMYREARLFLKHILRQQKPITDIFFADYSFLNERLADHYGIEGVEGDELRRVEIDNPRRGGVLGMGAFLTKTSTPLRTSPVHRGLWIYEEILDLPVPEPPPVPLLSDEGVDETGRTITEQLRQHRSDPACYSCHDRFDPLGVALENFDPIGRWRMKIEGKADVSSVGEFRSGEKIESVPGLKEFLRGKEDQLLEAFATKLIGYSLGRSVLPTDQPLLDQTLETMRANNLSIRSAVHVVLTSPQFLQRRDTELSELHSSL